MHGDGWAGNDIGPFGRAAYGSTGPGHWAQSSDGVPRDWSPKRSNGAVLIALAVITVVGIAIGGFYFMSSAFGAGAAGSCGGG